jgi:ABC-type transporter Mla subunit MlaD
MSIWKTVSPLKLLAVTALVALGVNGLVQVGLQRDMQAKTGELAQRTAQAVELSKQMNGGLVDLGQLKKTSEHMRQTLQQLQSATATMNQGLATLNTTVQGINGAVAQIGETTAASGSQVTAATNQAESLQSVLQQLMLINSDVISNLGQMIRDQQAINADLAEMNQKTRFIP